MSSADAADICQSNCRRSFVILRFAVQLHASSRGSYLRCVHVILRLQKFDTLSTARLQSNTGAGTGALNFNHCAPAMPACCTMLPQRETSVLMNCCNASGGGLTIGIMPLLAFGFSSSCYAIPALSSPCSLFTMRGIFLLGAWPGGPLLPVNPGTVSAIGGTS